MNEPNKREHLRSRTYNISNKTAKKGHKKKTLYVSQVSATDTDDSIIRRLLKHNREHLWEDFYAGYRSRNITSTNVHFEKEL